MSFFVCQVYFVAFILCLMENPVSKNVDLNQTPHHVASDLGLHCLPMTLLQVSREYGLKVMELFRTFYGKRLDASCYLPVNLL